MKIVQIKVDGNMNEVSGEFTKKNIRKLMREITGVKKYECLYEWIYDDSTVQCYGCLEGKAGKENKHELPPSGEKMVEALDTSDNQLLFNDMFMVKIEGNNYSDFDVADYGLFYTLCFDGFDDCYTDGESEISDDDTGSLNQFIVKDDVEGDDDDEEGDGDVEGDEDEGVNSDDSYISEYTSYSDDELDEDKNNY